MSDENLRRLVHTVFYTVVILGLFLFGYHLWINYQADGIYKQALTNALAKNAPGCEFKYLGDNGSGNTRFIVTDTINSYQVVFIGYGRKDQHISIAELTRWDKKGYRQTNVFWRGPDVKKFHYPSLDVIGELQLTDIGILVYGPSLDNRDLIVKKYVPRNLSYLCGNEKQRLKFLFCIGDSLLNQYQRHDSYTLSRKIWELTTKADIDLMVNNDL